MQEELTLDQAIREIIQCGKLITPKISFDIVALREYLENVHDESRGYLSSQALCESSQEYRVVTWKRSTRDDTCEDIITINFTPRALTKREYDYLVVEKRNTGYRVMIKHMD